jgi:hypothetical protein
VAARSAWDDRSGMKHDRVRRLLQAPSLTPEGGPCGSLRHNKPAWRIKWPTTYTFDVLSRETQRLFIDCSMHTFTFDAAGQLTVMKDVTGITTQHIRQCGAPAYHG